MRKIYKDWINRNINDNQIRKAQQYCQLMVLSFPELYIVRGVLRYNDEDGIENLIHFFYCEDEDGNPIDPLYQAFYKPIEYKTLEVIQEPSEHYG
jgi:hypothetical protein